MTGLLTALQMRAIEAAAIASGAVTGLDLMERAGRGVVEAIFAQWPELEGPRGGAAPAAPGYFGNEEAGASLHRAVVLCGPGNNGGDGFVIARLLKERGWAVAVWFFGDRARQSPDAAEMHDRWLVVGGDTVVLPDPMPPASHLPPEPWHEDLAGGHAFVIDALFGIGLSRPIDDDSGLAYAFSSSFREAREEEDVLVHRVAVDVPSGLCADSGRILSPFGRANFRTFFAADLTVATGYLKIGHFIGEGPQVCGKVVRASLGPLGNTGHGQPGYRNPTADCARLVGRDQILQGCGDHGGIGRRWLGKGPKGLVPAHKYDHGHALILSGGPGRGGAARLAARGALRIGAGLVTLGCPPEALAENAARLDAVMLRPLADGDAFARMLEDARMTALCLGPGLGTGEREAGLIAAALHRRGNPRPVVLDADALTLMASDASLFAALHERCVLTPHAGEFARLFPDLAERLAAPAVKGPAWSKVDATREAAARAGCVVLYKGPDTVIADPSGRCSINAAHYQRAAPWLATAGSGDVLAGFAVGLLARGFAPMAAAGTAAWLHVECARKFGPGLIAEDLPEALPAVFRDLGL